MGLFHSGSGYDSIIPGYIYIYPIVIIPILLYCQNLTRLLQNDSSTVVSEVLDSDHVDCPDQLNLWVVFYLESTFRRHASLQIGSTNRFECWLKLV
jgi:hypothetical protein